MRGPGWGRCSGPRGYRCSRCPSFFFTRATGTGKTQVTAAFRFDWYGKETDGSLERNWFGGGRVRITKLVEAPETGLDDYRGTKGNKLDWEMVPMGEYLAYTGQLPGDAVRNLTGADNTVHHPGNRFSLVTLRMFAVGVVIDRTTMEPVACSRRPTAHRVKTSRSGRSPTAYGTSSSIP